MENVIVKSNCIGSEQFAYFLRSRFYCKTVGTLHCVPHHHLAHGSGFPETNPFHSMDHIILTSEVSREYLDGVKNKRPFTVIPNGLPKPAARHNKSSDGVFRFIFANGWNSHKGMLKVIPAIHLVATKHKIEVVVLGQFTDKDGTIAKEISGLPIVNAGLVPMAEVERYYENADAALFASISESCPFAGIEAMARGLPIISTDAEGMMEMFGNAALLVKMDSDRNFAPEDYAEQMTRVIEDKKLRTKLGASAYSRYAAKYTADRMARETIKVYGKLLHD
jgi:glycosyltransferase involved in cell wall biosynthesis